MLKRTALYEEHIKLKAKIVPFAGWEMPVSYPTGIISEHLAVRANAGIFDVAHMGVIDITSNKALELILSIATNDAKLLSENEGQYSIISNENGGTIDDIFVFRLEDRYRLVVNASNTDKVLVWLNNILHSRDLRICDLGSDNIKIIHRTDLGILSVQGPKAKDLLGVSSLPKRNHCAVWGDLLFSHTGYTGEEGFEFFVPVDSLPNVWETLIRLGITPCGLGSRDTLRLEAGLPLYGHEYDDITSPLEVGYPWAVKFNHDFIGKEALRKRKESGISKKLVGLKLSDKAIPRQGAEIFANNKKIGSVSSGTFSPSLKIPIALAFVDPNYSVVGTKLEVLIRDVKYPAVVTQKKMV